MGSIPEYKGQGLQQTFDPGAIDRADDAADALSETAFQFAEIQQRQQNARNATYVAAKSIDLETRAVNRAAEWQKAHGDDPIGKEAELQKMIQGDVDELMKDAPSGAAKESFQRMSLDVIKKHSVGAAGWANEQVVRNVGRDIDQASQTLQLNAFRSANPAAIEDSLKQHATLLVAAETALSPKAVMQIKQVGERNIVAKAVEGMLDKNDLGGAQRLLDSKKYDQILGAEGTANAYEVLHRKREAMQDKSAKLHELKDRDPWKYLTEVGDAKDVKPLDFSGDVGKSFFDRATVVAQKEKKHNFKVPFISPDEVRHMSDSIKALAPKDAAMAFNKMAINVQPKHLAAFGQELFKEEPSLSAALMIAGDAPEDSRRIVGGMNLLRKGNAGKAIKPPSPEKMSKDFDAYIGNAVEDPNMRQAVRQAAEAHMVSSMFDRGAVEFEDYEDKDLHKSIAAVVGPVANINGRKTLSFRGKNGKWVDEDDLDDLFDDLTDKKVEKILGDVPRTLNGEPINLAKSNGRLGFRAVGDGAYWVFRDGQPALDKNKQPFRLDMKAIEKNTPKKQGIFSRIFGSSEAHAEPVKPPAKPK